MPDDDLDLHRLAPTVDAERARAAFHQRRRRSNAYRRGALAAAAVSVLVIGTVAALALSEDEPVRTGPSNVVDGVPTVTPTCSEIEQFAERITDVGISYDYEPTDGPEGLIDDSVPMQRLEAVAFSGVLTGEVSTGGGGGGEESWVGYEVDVRAVHKRANGEPAGGTHMAWIAVNASMDLTPFEEVARPGIPVVVVGEEAVNIFSGTLTEIEGFATACPGEAPIGRVGIQGTWTELRTLDDLKARLDDAAAANP